MRNADTTKVDGGGKLVQQTGPDREKAVPNMNKAMPSGFAGGPNDLSSTTGGNTPPSGRKSKTD